ncbi:MAG: lipoprotein [Hyphomicrobiales bacterium]
MTRKQMTTASVIGVLTLTLALGACGRRGALENDTQYEGAPYRGGGSGSLEDAVIGYDAEKPTRKFILDGII